jgi:hypothetical protein
VVRHVRARGDEELRFVEIAGITRRERFVVESTACLSRSLWSKRLPTRKDSTLWPPPPGAPPRKRPAQTVVRLFLAAVSTQGGLVFLFAPGYSLRFTAEHLSKAAGHRELFR